MTAWARTYPATLPLNNGCVAVLGNFDGVHAGHQALIAAAQAEGERLGLPVVALTFWPHPRTVLAPDKPLPLLQSLEERIESLHAAGVAGVAILPFNTARMGQSAADFAEDILQNWLHAKAIWVGENFKFGHKAQGTPALLNTLGLPCTALPLVADEVGVVSSSRFRVKTL